MTYVSELDWLRITVFVAFLLALALARTTQLLHERDGRIAELEDALVDKKSYLPAVDLRPYKIEPHPTVSDAEYRERALREYSDYGTNGRQA
jgi:hypothetical protein